MGKNKSLVDWACIINLYLMLLLLRVYLYGADNATTLTSKVELMFLMNTIAYIWVVCSLDGFTYLSVGVGPPLMNFQVGAWHVRANSLEHA